MGIFFFIEMNYIGGMMVMRKWIALILITLLALPIGLVARDAQACQHAMQKVNVDQALCHDVAQNQSEKTECGDGGCGACVANSCASSHVFTSSQASFGFFKTGIAYMAFEYHSIGIEEVPPPEPPKIFI